MFLRKLTHVIVLFFCISLLQGCSNEEPSIKGYEYVDLGLPSGLKWATCNIGASSPYDFGDYFAWGETLPKTAYTTENSTFYEKFFRQDFWKLQYDAAYFNWGSTWRLPTKYEINELISKCTWEKMSKNGVTGYRVVGPNGKSIFLPMAGYKKGNSTQYTDQCGCYWTSDARGLVSASLHLYFEGKIVNEGVDRYCGYTIRPVTE